MDDARNSATAHGDILFKNYKIQSLTVYVCICVACIHFASVDKKCFSVKLRYKSLEASGTTLTFSSQRMSEAQ